MAPLLIFRLAAGVFAARSPLQSLHTASSYLPERIYRTRCTLGIHG